MKIMSCAKYVEIAMLIMMKSRKIPGLLAVMDLVAGGGLITNVKALQESPK